jgi:hypothetical protein
LELEAQFGNGFTPWQITLEEATSCRPFILAEKQEIYVDSIEPSKVVYLEEKIAVSRKKRLKNEGASLSQFVWL